MLDFPASPTNGQKFPQPAVAGVPVYTWDGEKWTTAGGEIVTATPATALPLINATPALVGVTLKYAREDHVHPTDTTRASVGITESAMAYSGMQINGSFEVSQEIGSAGVAVNNFPCDGWKALRSGAMAITAYAAQTTSIVSGFPSHLYVTTPTAQTSLAAGDYAMIVEAIEGYRLARLAWGTANAQPITIAFWSKHQRAGVYCVSIRNGSTNRSYVTSYTHAVVGVEQYNVITVPGDTSGTWASDNTVGLQLSFCLASGTTYNAPSANTWAAGNYLAVAGQVNAVASVSDIFRLTGVFVLPGTEAPSAARSPYIMRSYGEEVMICRRYWQSIGPLARLGYGTAGYYDGYMISWQQMRAIPTITIPTVTYTSNCSGLAISGATGNGGRLYCNIGVSGSFDYNNGVAFLDARL